MCPTVGRQAVAMRRGAAIRMDDMLREVEAIKEQDNNSASRGWRKLLLTSNQWLLWLHSPLVQSKVNLLFILRPPMRRWKNFYSF